MARMIHSMIRVLDEERSVAFYRRAFGVEVAGRFDFETFTLLYLSNPDNDFELELTVNKDRATPYQLGDGYGHLAVSVADLQTEHDRVAAAGLTPTAIKALRLSDGSEAQFFFLTDPDGYKIEVLARAGRYH